jgi:hypothetical protein
MVISTYLLREGFFRDAKVRTSHFFFFFLLLLLPA